MKKYITDENNGLDYTLVGDVYLPNLISTETQYEIGLWGQRHLDYIKHHCKGFYTSLLTSCKLNSYLHDIDIRSTEMYDRLVKQLKDQQGITEQLKADDMMVWVQTMNNITNQVTKEAINCFQSCQYQSLLKHLRILVQNMHYLHLAVYY